MGVKPHDLTDVYDEGWVAYDNETPRESNPYLEAERFLTWQQGWDDAKGLDTR